MPGTVSHNEGVDCSFHIGVFSLENGELFATVDSVTDKLVKGLVHIDSLDVAIIDDQACLVACVIEFVVEGHQIVHEWHEVFHMSDCSRNLSEQGLFVELFRRKESGPDTVTQAIQAAEEGREVD